MSKLIGLDTYLAKLGYEYIDDLVYLYDTLVTIAAKYTNTKLSYLVASNILSLYYDDNELYRVVKYDTYTPNEVSEACRVSNVIGLEVMNRV